MLQLVTTSEMARADERAVELGVPALTLMENAGAAVADAAWVHLQAGEKVVVLCGPGNNGGDGFVAARLLAERGCAVEVALLGEKAALKGAAATMAERWQGAIVPLNADTAMDAKVLVDATFGAGLSRDIDGDLAQTIARINARSPGTICIAVDVPSGLDGNTGAERGVAVRADETVTFACLKPGHVLLPGRGLCGPTSVADIGIPSQVLDEVGSKAYALSGEDAAWAATTFPWRRVDAHKYAHGHAVVISGPAFHSGAARMAARGALRIGAGLVTVAAPSSALPENAAHLTSVMLVPCPNHRVLPEILKDTRKNAILIGPGAGVCDETAELVMSALNADAAVVLDADALTSFAGQCDGHEETARVGFGFTARSEQKNFAASDLFNAIGVKPERPVVMTPHDGEFRRLFPDLADEPSKLDRARAAASRSGAVVILKGADTVAAAPDGRAVVNTNAPPWLATAGSGDVLAGYVAGLVAQHVNAFEAATLAVWLHGECARRLGPGLIAEDLPEILPGVLGALHAQI